MMREKEMHLGSPSLCICNNAGCTYTENDLAAKPTMWEKLMHLRSVSLCILFLPHKKRRYI